MCVIDFEYYMSTTRTTYDRTAHARYQWCDCGHRPRQGEPVTLCEEIMDEEPCHLCDDRPGVTACSRCNSTGYEYEGHGDNGALAVDILCQLCTIAADVLDAWCDGEYGIGGIPQQVSEGYDHGDGRTTATQLARLADRDWRPLAPGPRIQPGVLRQLVASETHAYHHADAEPLAIA